MTDSIVVRDLVKQYRKAPQPAVNGISFTVREGSFFAFLGPNGAGKTTTISMLTTTLAKTSGTVQIAGYDLDTQASKVREKIGVIFQNHSLDLNLTAEENIRLHVALYGVYPFLPVYGWMPKEYKHKVEQLAELMGMEKNIFQKAKTLSGGMKRRFEIIRSLMHQPSVLFLDEPTSGLDPLSRRNLWEYLRGIREQQKTTVFLTTHYLDEVESADEVCIINQGKIVMQGTPQQLKERLVHNYILMDSTHGERLRSELMENQIRYTEGTPLKVHLDNLTAQEVIQKVRTPLTELRIHTPTMEDAYIEIIGEEHAGD